jgi:hypothetical protein
MKRITSLVAMIAAVMALGAAFAASASAGTVLCDAQANPCAPGDVEPAGSYFVTGKINDYSAFVIKGSGTTTLQCSFNLMSAKTTTKNGNPLPATFAGTLNPSSCKGFSQPAPNCASTSMNSPPTTLETTTENSGTMRIGSATQPLTISMQCNFPGLGGEYACTYAATGTVTMNVGEEAATIKAAPLTRVAGSSFACGTTRTLDVTNIMDGTSYLSKATETVLCGVPRDEASPCPNSEILPVGSTVLTAPVFSEHGISLKPSWGTPWLDCKQGHITFKNTQESGAPLPAQTSATYLNAASCAPENKCSSVTLNTPSASIESTGVYTGVINVGTAAEPLTLSYTCTIANEPRTCTFAATGTVKMNVDYAAGDTATVKSAPMTLIAGEGIWCGGTKSTLDIKFQIRADEAISVV